jgi:hypothetical protein
MTELQRKCPDCEKILTYSSKTKLKRAIGDNSKCLSCSRRGMKFSEEHRRKLSIASSGKILSESTRKKISIALTGKTHTEEHRLNVSLSRRGDRHWLYGKQQSDSVKEKLRTSHKKRLDGFRERGIPFRIRGKIKTSYNPDACKLFDIINEELKWDGKHALNDGEVQIAGYWVDFYEETVKLIIEYDEKHHERPSSKDRDLKRQQTIQFYLPDYTIIRIKYDETEETIIQRLREYANSKKQ